MEDCVWDLQAVDTSYPSWTNSNALSLGRFNKEWHQTGERPPADVSASPYQTPLQPDLTAHVPDSFRAPSAVPKTILALDHDDMLKDELGDNHRDMLNAVAQLGFEKGRPLSVHSRSRSSGIACSCRVERR